MIKKVGILIKESAKSLALARKIATYLADRKIEYCFDLGTAAKIDAKGKGVEIKDMEVDLILALGGDGTILKIASLISGKKIPILGINFGTSGFLTQTKPAAWKQALEAVLSGEYKIEEKSKIEARVNGRKIGEALNEVVIITAVPVKMLTLEIFADKQVVGTFRADGIILSTSTGSTAYSMSAGGPVVDPRVPAFVLTSICPFQAGLRSIVLSERTLVEVKLAKSKSEAFVVVDGERREKLGYGETASFSLSKNKAYFVQFKNNFFSRVGERFI